MRITTIAIALTALGCASGGGSASRFTFGPAEAPLRYEVMSNQEVSVETPMGSQQNYDTVEVTLAISVGDATEAGHRVTTSFEAISIRSQSAGGSQSLDGGDLIGQSLPGTLHPTGQIELESRPSMPERLSDVFDPVSFMSELMVRMPADGNVANPWPMHIESTSETAMHVTGVYDGTAQVVGDTVWNGTPAKIIHTEGTLQISGKGMPAGVPAELHMTMSGTSTRRYVWDPMRGVMLAGRATDNANGTVSIPDMNLDMPAVVESRWSAALKQ